MKTTVSKENAFRYTKFGFFLTIFQHTHLSMAGFLRRMLGRGEDTNVGAPPTPWACACTMVPTGWVALNVLVMGFATKPSAKTTPER